MNNVKREPIAVIGTACRFPGNVSNIDEYWEFLKKGGDAVAEIPQSRWDWAFHYDQEIDKIGKSFVKKACFIDWDIESFDAAFFDISPREAAVLDPQQRLLLEVTFEALEDAVGDVTRLKGSNTGVYMGCFMQDNLITQMGSGSAKSQLGTHTAVSSTMTMISNRLSYTFDLQGPSFTLDTACSSSLVAVHQACRGLLAADCDMALTGGVSLMFRPEVMMMMSKGRFLAKDGRSKTFSAHADGYGRGEGAGIAVLKRYSDALRDGDTIHGLILGSGVNQDGSTDGITVPSEHSQKNLAHHVYQEANINPDDITYLEAHGTGTPVGDPIEMRAMGTAISKNRPKENSPLVVGSVKAGMGHLEAAAGIAGFLKSLLVAKHGEIPPQAWLDDELNPAIDFAGLNLKIADKTQAAPQSKSGKSYVAVNSFGYGGTNAHAVIAKAPEIGDDQERNNSHTSTKSNNKYFSLNISAASEAACEIYAKHYLAQLENCENNTALQLCRDAASKSQLTHRWSISDHSLDGLKKALTIAIEDKKSENVTKSKAHRIQKPVLVFSGMGPQWWAMGQDLMKTEPLFAEKLKQADIIFKNISGWSILDEMAKPEEKSKILETEIAQPANFMIQMGLYELLKSWGIKPAAVVGHSVGEVSSGYASGSLSLEDALSISYYRSHTQAKTAGTGTMIATALSQSDAEKYLIRLDKELAEKDKGKVSVAGINSASSTTMAGDETILDKIIADLEEQNIFVRKLRVEVPYHSAGMDPILEELETSLQTLSPKKAAIPLYSSVTGGLVGGRGFDASYWCNNVRKPVYFEQAVNTLLDAGHELFLEVGPHPVLSGYIKETILKSDHKGSCVATLRRKEDSSKCLREAVALLWTSGVEVDFIQYLGEPNKHADLLSYPWQRKTHWSETKYDKEERQGWASVNPLLGRRLPVPVPTWQTELSLSIIPWLADHQVGQNVVFPGAGYIDTLLAGMNNTMLAEGRKMVMKNIHFHRAMVLSSAEDATLKTVVENSNQIKIFAGLGSKQDDWQLYADASLLEGVFEKPSENPIDLLDLSMFEDVSVDDLYQSFSEIGLDYGKQFRSIKRLKRSANHAVIDLEVTPDSRYNIHPALLDGAFQGMLTLLKDVSNTAYLPVQIEEMRLYAKPKGTCQALLSITASTDRFITADIKLIVADEVAVEVLGVRCDAVQLSTDSVQTELEDVSYRLAWYQKKYSEEELVTSNKVAVVGENIPEEFADGLIELGAEDVLLFTSIEQFSQHKNLNDLETLAVFIHSNSAEDAVNDAAAMVSSFQKLHSAGYAGTVSIITHEALAAEVRHSVNNWNTAWVTGFRRCAHNELSPITIRHIDIDNSVSGAALAVEISVANAEDEVVLTHDERWAMQITRVNKHSYNDLQNKVQHSFEDKGNNSFELKVPTHRSVTSLTFNEHSRIPPAKKQIEVQIDTVALNYKDYAKVNGILTESMLEKTFSGMTIGLECEGTVVKLGKGVTDYKVGEKVAVTTSDCFKRYITVNTDPYGVPYTVIKPQIKGFKAGQTAACFVAYGTALWGLRDVAHLKKGESVLIHGAAGGVGLAAIYVAKLLGATVVASAGSQSKRDYLLKHGADHVVNSRTLNFAETIKSITKGKGVDVVLNSASGGIVDFSIEALASFGRFIEIGKKDIFQNNKLSLAQFEKSISYSTLDLEYYTIEHESDFVALMDDLFSHLEKGELAPLEITSFHADDIQQAFSFLAKSQHIGKVCIDMNVLPQVAQYKQRNSDLDADKCLIITGGLGGLGALLGKWCIDHGAKKLVLLGRKGAATEDAKAAVKTLQEQGAKVDVYACDATDFNSLSNVFKEIEKKWIIGGVIHAAGVLDDKLLLDLDESSVIKVARPKIIGLENLNRLTKDNPSIDIFWAISSISAFTGNMHQTNYALANTYMDSLMESRQAVGLPGNTIQLGPIGGVGMATKNENLEQYIALRGMPFMDEALFHASFTRVMEWNLPIMTMAILEWPVWGYAEPRAASSHRAQIVMSEDGADNSADSTLNSIAQLPAEERPNLIGYILIEHIAGILQMDAEDVELDAPLESFGIDSLAAVELQLLINKSFQVEISILSMLGDKTIMDIATELAGLMDFDNQETPTTQSQPQNTLAKEDASNKQESTL